MSTETTIAPHVRPAAQNTVRTMIGRNQVDDAAGFGGWKSSGRECGEATSENTCGSRTSRSTSPDEMTSR
jgi:hypothetical protein